GVAEPAVAKVLPDLLPPATLPTWLATHRDLIPSRRMRLVFARLASTSLRPAAKELVSYCDHPWAARHRSRLPSKPDGRATNNSRPKAHQRIEVCAQRETKTETVERWGPIGGACDARGGSRDARKVAVARRTSLRSWPSQRGPSNVIAP